MRMLDDDTYIVQKVAGVSEERPEKQELCLCTSACIYLGSTSACGLSLQATTAWGTSCDQRCTSG